MVGELALRSSLLRLATLGFGLNSIYTATKASIRMSAFTKGVLSVSVIPVIV